MNAYTVAPSPSLHQAFEWLLEMPWIENLNEQHAANMGIGTVASGIVNKTCNAGCAVQMLKRSGRKGAHMGNGHSSCTTIAMQLRSIA